jgi:hypothetical protein
MSVDIFIPAPAKARRLSKMLSEMAAVEGIRITSEDRTAEIQIHTPDCYITADLTHDKIDAIIRVLGLARVELSKARPR